MAQAAPAPESLLEDVGKRSMLPAWWRWTFVALAFVGLTVAVLQIFMLVPMFTNFYLYFLLAVFLSPVFILYRARRDESPGRLPWYDIVLACVTLAVCVYLMIHAVEITDKGWAFGAPFSFNVLSLVLVLVSLEAVRRAGGTVLFVFTSFFAAYPLFAEHMPGILRGASFPVWSVVNYHVLSTDSVLGLPTQVVGTLVIGYMVFGVVMAATGGGKFFLDIAFALLGTHKGGPAKVAVISSGIFGSMSGSVISNVLTTGSVTIPAMKRTGYERHYAGAIEACASTGGALMPPVMGTVAFVMASILQVSYWDVVKAAAIPAFLYYWGLFVQVDSYAGRRGLRGIERSQAPALGPVLRAGWPYLLAFAVLSYFIYQQREGAAPFYGSAVLLAVSVVKRQTRLDLKALIRMVEDTGKVLVEVTAVLAACGYILGSFSMTGLGSSFSREIVDLAGSVPILLLLCGAMASYILGMGMTATACYLFLAIILTPALVKVGFSLMASHLFVLYWGLVSFITPPVALGAYAAAGLAGTSAMKTGYTAMRMGIILYLVPFFFMYEPSLVFEGPLVGVVQAALTATLGVALLGSSMEGYLTPLGRLALFERVLLFGGGLVLIWPGWRTDLIGLLSLGSVLLFRTLSRRRSAGQLIAEAKVE